jgi:TolB protein
MAGPDLAASGCSCGEPGDERPGPPDGRRIAYVGRMDGESHIYVLGSGEAPNKVTHSGPHNWGPAWSPDGKRILFYSDRLGSGRDQILVVNADGSGERALTNDTFNNIFPSWSPDGGRVLFCSNREGSEGIYEMNVDGSSPRRLFAGTRAFFARWSPDGKRIAFIGGDFPDTKIYLANANGSNLTQLTK